MTETDVLRAMLDERGVEWGDDGYPTTCTVWASDGIVWHGLWRDDCIELIAHLTPEQAVEVALKQAVRHPKPHEKWTTVLLPEIAWGWDDSWPDYLSVAHDANGEWRTYVPEATLGAGTCHDEGTFKSWGLFTCSNCSIVFPLDAVKDAPSIGRTLPPNYCPNCGRRVEQ